MNGSVRFGVSVLACIGVALLVLLGASAEPVANGGFGGTLVVGLTRSYPDTLDVSTEAAFGSVKVLRAIAERLYDFNAKGNVYPELASKLPTISPDKLTYTIPLRKGIEFNDDTPFNAHAVVVSLERDLTLPGRNALAKVVYDGAMVPDCTPISPESTAVYDPTIRCTPYDPQDAKRLVAKAGYPEPHRTSPELPASSVSSSRPRRPRSGSTSCSSQEDGSTALSDEISGRFDAIAATFTGSPALDKNVYEFLATSGGRNFGGYSNPRLDQILANARKATSAKVAEDAVARSLPDHHLGSPHHLPRAPDRLRGRLVRREGSGVPL